MYRVFGVRPLKMIREHKDKVVLQTSRHPSRVKYEGFIEEFIMFDKRSKYLDVFEDTMEQAYKDLKKTGIIPPELKGYIDGYMRAGRILGLAGNI